MAVVNMPVECLVPHPQNPRKDLGNLEELTASIKENGIYQNLTVIPVNEAVPGGWLLATVAWKLRNAPGCRKCRALS